MKKVGKFRCWLLKLFGGVPKADYDLVVEQRENFIGDLKINNSQIKSLEQENELLKKQIAHDPLTPVAINVQNAKIIKIKRIAAIGPLPLDKTESCLRDAVLAEAAQFVKIERQPYNMRITATLLLAEKEDD